MKKNLFIFISIGLLIACYGCIDDPKMTPGIVGAKEPEFEGPTVRLEKTASTITVSAKVSKENGDKITERGFYYGLVDPPTTKIIDTSTGIGEYTLKIEGLTNNERYYIRPYAENSQGTGYGEQLVDSTNIGFVGVTTMKPDSIHAASARAGGTIDLEGEGNVVSMGVYLYQKDNATDIDTIDCGTTYPIQPRAGMDFFCQLKNLTPSTWYYVRAFATNSFGTTVGGLDSLYTLDGKPVIGATRETARGFTDVTLESSVTNGGDETVVIVECGFCWVVDAVSSVPTVSHQVVTCVAGIDGSFEGTINGLVSSERYYARAYAISNLGITVYGDSILSIQTKKDFPTVSTHIVTSFQGGNANVSGSIDDEGQYPIVASGICWSTTEKEPTISNAVLPLTPGANGELAGQLTRLRGDVTYYVCAFATNDQGVTGYGEVRQFTTPPIFTAGLKPFPGRYAFAGTLAYFAIDRVLYILGGDLGASNTNELWRYSIDTDSWLELSSFIGSPARFQTAVAYGSGALVYGGDSRNGTEKPGIYHYLTPPFDNTWIYYEGPPDAAIVNRTIGFSYNNSVYFIGGATADSVRNNVWSYEFPVKTWRKEDDFPAKQYGGIAVVIDGVAYAGMGNINTNVCNNTLWAASLSEGALTWNYKSSYPVARHVWGGVVCNDLLYIVDDDYYLIEYNPRTNVWTKKSQLPSGRRSVYCIYSVDYKIYIGFGTDDALVIYDPLWDN